MFTSNTLSKFSSAFGLAVLFFVGLAAHGQVKIVEKNGSDQSQSLEKDGFFIPIEQAKDCAYDYVRQRLYVTTLSQLVVVDMKERKVMDSVDLLGNVQGIDLCQRANFLALAPIGAQYIYKIKLDWTTLDKMEVTRIKFKAPGNEPGVFSLGIGANGAVLFTTTFSGSGWVALRRLNPDDSVTELGQVGMDSLISVSGDRNKAIVAGGNVSSGPLRLYDFTTKALGKETDLQCFMYEIAYSADGSRIARPDRRGCDLYDGKGTKLGSLSGAPVIAAAYNPKTDSLYVMRHQELTIQEYDREGKLMANSYPLDKPLVIKGDVHSRDVVNLQPVGPNMVQADVRRVVHVNFHTYQSGRLHVSEDGKSLCATVPTGVYIFPIKPSESTASDNAKPKVKIIDK